VTDHEARQPNGEEPAVDEVLAQLKAGVRQRQAELATVDEELRRLPASLAEAHRLYYIHEPECVSHRPVIGRVIVFFKKGFYLAFMKWFMSSVIEQQNEFNRTATEALRDLFERQTELSSQTQRIEEALDRLGSLHTRDH